jgi:hypothetical protein
MSQTEYVLVLATVISTFILAVGLVLLLASGQETLFQLGFGMLVVTAFGGMIATVVGYLRNPSDD